MRWETQPNRAGQMLVVDHPDQLAEVPTALRAGLVEPRIALWRDFPTSLATIAGDARFSALARFAGWFAAGRRLRSRVALHTSGASCGRWLWAQRGESLPSGAETGPLPSGAEPGSLPPGAEPGSLPPGAEPSPASSRVTS